MNTTSDMTSEKVDFESDYYTNDDSANYKDDNSHQLKTWLPPIKKGRELHKTKG